MKRIVMRINIDWYVKDGNTYIEYVNLFDALEMWFNRVFKNGK